MRGRCFLLLAGIGLTLAWVASAGCGSAISIEDGPDDVMDAGDAGPDAKPDGGGGGTVTPEAGKDAFDEYVDPGCPDAGPALEDYQCDPWNQYASGCAPGEGCYIFVHYPEVPCGQEIYGSLCAPAGPGTQGDVCYGAQDCGSGFVCVVSGSGNQCVELCPLEGDDGCPAGLVCEPIDVEGFGGCL